MRLKKSRGLINILIGIVFIAVILTFYSTFSIDTEYKMESLVYDIGDGYIEGVSPYTEVSLFIKYFDLDNCSIKVKTKDNKELNSGFVPNGSMTVLYDNNGKALTSYVNVIKGDYTEDGIIDMNDFREIGYCLVNGCELEEYQLKGLDIDLDGELHQNDILLLDQAYTNGYSGIALNVDSMVLQTNEQSRLVAKVSPSYGVNQNVKWVSLDEEIATVDEAGVVTGHNEGETRIEAITMDGKFKVEATIKVDNTIQLLSYEGIAYIGGDDLRVGIKLIDYEGVTCSSSNEEVANCWIEDKELVMSAKDQGNVTITVKSLLYGEAVYKLDTYSVYLNVMPKYFCTTPLNVRYITVSGFYTGDLSYEMSDNEMIRDAYMSEVYGRNMLRIDVGDKQGRGILTVKESNGNTRNNVTIDVYSLSIPEIGKVAKVGEEVSTTIAGDNLGQLRCVTPDESKATCRIEGNQLIVMPLQKGSVTIQVYNQFLYEDDLYDCGSTQFLVVVQE